MGNRRRPHAEAQRTRGEEGRKIDKKSGITYFDHYIGSSKEVILSLQSENTYSDNKDVLKYFNNDSYVFFYFKNDIVKKIEYGNRIR